MSDYSRQIQSFYSTHTQHEWERMDRHRTEFGVTLKLMAEHLPPAPARILDIGGGPGRYAIELARRGYPVTLFDLTPDNLALAREKAQQMGVRLSGIEQGNAMDLSRFPSASFDAVLLMGPLYHLLDLEDRRKAVAEAARVLRPGGVMLATFITRYAALRYAARSNPEWIVREPERTNTLLQTGRLLPGEDAETSFVSYMAHPSEAESLFWDHGLEVKGQWGVEGLVSQLEDSVNDLPPETFTRWLEINALVASDPSLFGCAEHLLVASVKPAWRPLLRRIAAQLDQAGLSYTVVGGTSAALNGVQVVVRDIDIEMTTEGAYHFQQLFADHVAVPVGLRTSERYQSHFGRFDFDGVIVEVMGNLQRREGDAWVNTWAQTRHAVSLDDVPVSVSWLEEETLAYIRRGRLDRAARCLLKCDPARLMAFMRHLQPTQVI